MNRRRFLKAALGGLAAIALPIPVSSLAAPIRSVPIAGEAASGVELPSVWKPEIWASNVVAANNLRIITQNVSTPYWVIFDGRWSVRKLK